MSRSSLWRSAKLSHPREGSDRQATLGGGEERHPQDARPRGSPIHQRRYEGKGPRTAATLSLALGRCGMSVRQAPDSPGSLGNACGVQLPGIAGMRDVLGEGQDALSAHEQQIGRASCRERV